jgi:hypothetical protein
MSHKHWCDITGHEWECDGTHAVRLGDIHPSPCRSAGIDGIEMVPCPEHLPEVQRSFEAAMRDPHLAALYARVIAGELRALHEFMKYTCGDET